MNLSLRTIIRQILITGNAALLTAGSMTAGALQITPPGPGMVPDYFGAVPNYANSPQPIVVAAFPTNQVDPTVTTAGSGAVFAVSTYDYVNGVQTGGIVSAEVINGGTGYDANTTITVYGGPSASGAQIVPTIVGGVITGLTITNPGTGYNSPIPGSGIRKFVDTLSTLNTPNNLGQQLPVAVPDTTTFPGSDYYEIAETEYTQKLHTDLPPTHLRGYKQLNAPVGHAAGTNQYLGPVIVAQRDRPVRIKLVNQLSKSTDATGAKGTLPFPVDKTYMGASGATDTDNRTALHLHGGNTPWISDGTPRQTIKPAGEVGANKGASATNVPDMYFVNGAIVPQCSTTVTANCSLPADANGKPQAQTNLPVGASNDPGNGALTFYFTNQQSARLMFYHDHAEGLTRLNVYAGMAAGYVLRDPTEQAMMNGGVVNGVSYTKVLPPDEIPLVIQEKTFVPDDSVPIMNFWGTFASQLKSQDPTWRWGSGTPAAPLTFNGTGDLWVPHVFMPNQNPGDISGANAMGRWDYGPWFWPPFSGIQHGPVQNPYYDPACVSSTTHVCEGQFIPGVPNGNTYTAATLPAGYDPTLLTLGSPSGTPESFNDTPLVNGTVYPSLTVEPKKYRLRILSVGNDRMLNLSLVVAASKKYASTAAANTGIVNTAVPCDGVSVDPATGALPLPADCTEVKMVPFDAAQNAAKAFPSWWYTAQKGGISFDGRPSGVFDPTTRGPEMVQIGTEGGFLSQPAVIRNQPVNFEYNPKNIVVGNIKEHALLLGPAERADVVVDFSQFAGSTLILYNDAPAPVPAFDLRLDYFTGDFDNTDTGGAFSTLPGYGPNSRTIMQINVASTCTSTNCADGILNRTPSTAHTPDDVDSAHLATLGTEVKKAFKNSQEPIIVPQVAYNATYGTAVNDAMGGDISRIADNALTYAPLADPITGLISTTPVTLNLEPKSIIEDWTMDYGRMNALLGTEIPRTTATVQTSIPQAYIDPPTELVKMTPSDSATNITPISGTLKDGTQLWKITHNGVDSHAMHFHLFHVQIVNRVGWDGAVRLPDANELGWKDTVRMNPLEDAIVALRPKTMVLPFKVPNSHRLLDPSLNANFNPTMFFNLDPTTGNASSVLNTAMNFGWEYVWHCHILGHEENDMMRAIAVAQTPEIPTAVSATGNSSVVVNWNDNSVISNWVTLQRDTVNTFNSANLKTFNVLQPECAVQTGCTGSFTDTTAPATATPVFYRVQANNTVGGGDVSGGLAKAGVAALTPGFAGYSNVTANSDWSNTITRVVTPVASVSPTSLAFGYQGVNTTSATKTITVQNTGLAALAIASKASNNAAFVLTVPATGGCGTTLAVGASCTLNVAFKPSAVGAVSGAITLTDNANGVANAQQTVTLTGSGANAAATPVLSPATLTFASTNVGATSAAQVITLTNGGVANLNVTGTSVTGPYAIASTTCTTGLALKTGQSCTVNVTFKPTVGGAATGTLSIKDLTGTVTRTTSAALSGTGQVVATADTSTQAANTSASQTFTMTVLTNDLPTNGTVAIVSSSKTSTATATATVNTSKQIVWTVTGTQAAKRGIYTVTYKLTSGTSTATTTATLTVN